MKINLNHHDKIPLYQQIVTQMRQQILSKELPVGFILPSERKLAELLNVNRTTILNAYRELKSENLITSQIGKGTFVLEIDEDKYIDTQMNKEPVWNHFLSNYSSRLDEFDLNELLNHSSEEETISFAAGVASLNQEMTNYLKEIEHNINETQSVNSFFHSPIEGFVSLRETIAKFMKQRGSFVTYEEVMVTSGSQQAIYLASQVLLDPGDIIVVEASTYFPALQVFKSLGAKILTVSMDKDGIIIEELEEILSRYHPKLIYTIPNFHNPTGTLMSFKRRKLLLKCAIKNNTLILEDDAYGDLVYEFNPIPTIKSLDSSGYVIYISTFSKIIYPGLRIGWLVTSKKIMRQLSNTRQMIDLHTNCFSQLIIENFLEHPYFNQHMETIKKEYKEKRDLMIKYLNQYTKGLLSFDKPSGGYYIWCKLPPEIKSKDLLYQCSLKHVVFLPCDPFITTASENQYIRLNFTYASKKQIEQGIKVIADVLIDMVQNKPNKIKIIETKPII